MAWNYRKRITIAPGVRLNVSKKGVSTTFGIRGASINVGQKGTYLNTGIPGTGIYRRQKIGGNNENYFMSNKKQTDSNSGCLGWLVYGVLFSFIVGAILFKQEEYRFWGILMLICTGIWLLFVLGAYINKLFTNRPSAKAQKENKLFQAQIELARNALSQTTNPTQKAIIQNFITCAELSRKADETVEIIEALKQKIEKKTSNQLEEQLEKHEVELSKITVELDEVQLNADKDLDDVEKWQYSLLCENFEKILLSKKIWLITSSVRNTELKSSAASTVERKEVNFDAGVFNYIKSSFDIPMLRDLSGNTYYLYPRYIIKAQSFINFETFPIDTVNIRYSKQRFIEDGILPDDSHAVDYTYQYVNKDGGPDKRFSYNPRLPIVEYGKIEIEKFGLTFFISNHFAANAFVNSYNLWKNEPSDVNDIPLQQNEITEEYFFQVDEVTEKLVSFFNELTEDHDFKNIADKKVSFDKTVNGVLTIDIFEKIRTLFHIDIVRTYVGLGHPINLKSKEGLGLILVLIKTMHKYDRVQFDHLNIILDETFIKTSENYMQQVKTVIDSNSVPEGKFIVSWILEKYNADLQRQYLILLYRFASIIAKSDGVVTEYEQKWLSKLLQLSNLNEETTNFKVSEQKSISILDEIDPLFEDAARIIVTQQRGSTSLIQRTFSIGYSRAGQIIDQLEAAGIVSAFSEGKARQVLIKTENELKTLLMELSSTHTTTTITQQKEKPERVYPILKSNSQKELKSLIGLSSVKSEIETLTNFIKIQQERVSKGLKIPQPSYHCVFTGNPGTGKTTVARIVAEIYKELGVLQKGHLVETDRSGLIAEYVGQTAVKTNKIIDTALDGVLFIDEAYSLISKSENDYGKEAIATLLKRMEDNRDRLVVILAGYTDEMQKFIDSNPGLQSRFNRYIEFPDYSDKELYQIFELNLKQFDYTLAEDVKNPLREFLKQTVINKDKNFGNARYIRNLFEKTIERQANRLSKEVNLTNEKLSEICLVDLPCN